MAKLTTIASLKAEISRLKGEHDLQINQLHQKHMEELGVMRNREMDINVELIGVKDERLQLEKLYREAVTDLRVVKGEEAVMQGKLDAFREILRLVITK